MRTRRLGRLPVHVAGATASLEDFFIHGTFHRIGGSYLHYITGVPEDPRVHTLLRRMGVAVAVNEATLLKCLRWLRAQSIQDIGVAAHIYMQLGNLGFSGFGSEGLIFAPGRGYLSASSCTWLPFRSDLLRRCCCFEVLSEHYNRFGADVCNALQQWVMACPEADPFVLCETLQQVIRCTMGNAHDMRRFGKEPNVEPNEAARGLLNAAKVVIKALAQLCAFGRDQAVPRVCESSSSIACHYFALDRMIVIPSAPDSPRCSLLHVTEAFWSVAPALKDTYATKALDAHYMDDGDFKYFFVDVLGVRPELCPEDVKQMQIAQMSPQLPQSTFSAVQGRVDEGLNFCASMPRSEFDPRQALVSALQRARSLRPTGSWDFDRGRLSETVSSNEVPEGPGAATPAVRREWRQVGALCGLPVFVANAARGHELHMGFLDPTLLYRLCSALGLHPGQIALAYDPSGRCVCDEQLFLDVTLVSRTAHLPTQSATLMWAMELCQAVAHQGVGPALDKRLLQVQSELLALILPMVLPSHSWHDWQPVLGAPIRQWG